MTGNFTYFKVKQNFGLENFLSEIKKIQIIKDQCTY